MGIGLVAISTTQKRELLGPFALGSAHNGTSIDAGGLIVLGNDVGQPGSPAKLTSDREIVTNDGAGSAGDVVLQDNTIGAVISQKLFGSGSIINGALGSTIIENRQVGTDIFNMAMAGAGSVQWSTGAFGGTPCMELKTVGATDLGHWQIGAPINITKNPATLQVNGSLSAQSMSRTMSTGTYTVDRTFDSNMILTNPNATGPVTVTLPNMAFSGTTGFYLTVAVTTALTVLIRAFAGQTIYVGDGAMSSVGGSIRASTIGSIITLFCADQLSWFTGAQMGTWTLA